MPKSSGDDPTIRMPLFLSIALSVSLFSLDAIRFLLLSTLLSPFSVPCSSASPRLTSKVPPPALIAVERVLLVLLHLVVVAASAATAVASSAALARILLANRMPPR